MKKYIEVVHLCKECGYTTILFWAISQLNLDGFYFNMGHFKALSSGCCARYSTCGPTGLFERMVWDLWFVSPLSRCILVVYVDPSGVHMHASWSFWHVAILEAAFWRTRRRRSILFVLVLQVWSRLLSKVSPQLGILFLRAENWYDMLQSLQKLGLGLCGPLSS